MMRRDVEDRLRAVEASAEGLGRDPGTGELTEYDRWLLAALLTPGLEGPEPPAEPPDADPELMELLHAALEDGGQVQAEPERALQRVRAGVLIRPR